MKPISQLKRKPKTLVQLFKSPKRWIKERLFNATKGGYDSSTSFCVRGGAFYLCAGFKQPTNYTESDQAWNKAQEIEQKVLSVLPPLTSICQWNNNPNLTHKEFLETLKKAGV